MNKIIRTGELDYTSAFINTTDESGNAVEKKLYAPIFRIKNSSTYSGTYTRCFLNFTVWWESYNRYSAKTYSVNACITSNEYYKYIFTDETPDNQEFEIVALSDKTKNGYTTYYVTFPTGSNTIVNDYYVYNKQFAQIVINKCDLLQNIEFLGARPFNIDVTATTLTLYRDALPNVTLTAGASDTHLIDTTYRNQIFFRNRMIYVDCGIYARNTESAVGDISGALNLNGITLTKALQLIVPYTSSVADSGICTFVVNTDGTIDIKNSQKRMQARLQFVLDESYYKISNEE